MASEEDQTEDAEDAPKKGGKGMLFGIIGAVMLGGGGFFAAFSGMLPIGGGEAEAEPAPVMVAELTNEFVPLDQLIISLGSAARARHLQFTAQLEVEPIYAEEVTGLIPRVLDVLNTYLRAVDERDLETPAAMTRLRAQMLRRVQIVTGNGRVKDLLITEFVLN